MASPPDEPISIGPHHFRIEGDLSVVVVMGDVEAEHVVSLQQISRQLVDKYGYTLTLVDARKAGTMSRK